MTGDITHIATAVYDEDRTATSREFIERFIASGYFDYDYYLSSPAQIDPLLQSGKAQFVLVIPLPLHQRSGARAHGARCRPSTTARMPTPHGLIAGYAEAIVAGI